MLQKRSFLKLITLSIATLLFMTCFTATGQTSADTSIVGMWQGTLEIGGMKLRIVFHVVKTDGGKFVSTMDSPDQGATGIPVSSTTISGDSVVFAIASIGGSYKGSISSDKSSIKGKWSQGGASLDLPLNRTSPAVETAQTPADTSIVGMWQGTLEIGRMKLRIVFHVVKTDSGKFVSTVDSPDQGAKGIPVSRTTVSGDSIVFIVAIFGGSYKGSISGDKSSIEGKWNQGGASINLSLTRTTVEIKFNRPQEPKPPFPYKAEDVSYENSIQNVKLAGTLTTPGSGGPFPAVILITGSGAQNRNEELLGHKPFLVIADYLTRRGIAVLRVDDRGVGGSTGSTKNSTTADFATDVLAGMSFLKNRSDINSHKIGLIGHSKGGIIAPMVASQSNDVAFIVMLAGPGLPEKTS